MPGGGLGVKNYPLSKPRAGHVPPPQELLKQFLEVHAGELIKFNEVVEFVGVPQDSLRRMDQRFPEWIKPTRMAGGRKQPGMRLYTCAEVDVIWRLWERICKGGKDGSGRYTVAGLRKVLRGYAMGKRQRSGG